MSISSTMFLTKEGIKLENDKFSAILLPTEGSNLISFYDKQKQMELLRTPRDLEDYEKRRMICGTPVLFPPNRIEDATFSYKGKTYHLEMNRAKENNHIHGFVHDIPWRVVSIDQLNNRVTTELNSAHFPDIQKQFPHHFILTMTVELTNEGIIQSLEVKNASNKKMPTGLGYHTTFNFFTEESTLQIELDKQWELNDRKLPTGHFLAVENKELLSKGIQLNDVALDDIYPIVSDNKAVIHHRKSGIRLTYEATKGFTQWVLFTANGKENLLAIEPYSWVTNAPNINLPSNLTGLTGINPSESQNFITKLTVEHI